MPAMPAIPGIYNSNLPFRKGQSWLARCFSGGKKPEHDTIIANVNTGSEVKYNLEEQQKIPSKSSKKIDKVRCPDELTSQEAKKATGRQ